MNSKVLVILSDGMIITHSAEFFPSKLNIERDKRNFKPNNSYSFYTVFRKLHWVGHKRVALNVSNFCQEQNKTTTMVNTTNWNEIEGNWVHSLQSSEMNNIGKNLMVA